MAAKPIRPLRLRDIFFGDIGRPLDDSTPKAIGLRRKRVGSYQVPIYQPPKAVEPAEVKLKGNGEKRSNNGSGSKKSDKGNGSKKSDMGNGSKKSDKDKGNGSKHGSKNGKDKKDEKTGGDAQAGDGFTAEQDAQLMQMKTENKPWRDVCEALGKPQDVLKNRFKEIKPDGWQPGKGGKQGGGDIQNQKQEKPEKQDKKEKANGSAKADGGTKESKKENKKQKAEKKEVKAGNGQKYETIEEDDDFPADALQAIYKAMLHQENHYWPLIASRVFDKTGYRYNPDDLAEKMGHARLSDDN